MSKKRPQVTNEMAWLENIPTGSSSQKILQRAAVIKIQVKICPLSHKQKKNPGKSLGQNLSQIYAPAL